MKSLFTPLKAQGLTTLKIRHNYKKGTFRFYAAKEWDTDLDFSMYNKEFCIDDIYTDHAIYLNSKQVKELYSKYNLDDYLEKVLDLIKKGKHFGMDLYYYDKYNIKYIMHEHSRKQGLLNKSHSIMAGGIRRHPVEEKEIDVIIDGLNLGRGMSFKNIAANLPFGGCKATVQMGPLDLTNMEVMGFLAFAIDSCRDMTGPDMNFPAEMSDVMIEEGYSMQYTGGLKAKTGATGKPTAYGVYLSLKQAVKFKEGRESLRGKSAAIMGLGEVGWHMAEHLLLEDVKLYIADIDSLRTKEFVAKHQGKEIEIVHVDEIIEMDVDIVVPCAVGGVLHDENIPKLKCQYVWGAANSQLRASSQEEEYRLAKLLDEYGVLYQVEWWHNIAGVMCGAEEYLYDGNEETIKKKVEETIPVQTMDNLNKSKELGITPTECAYITCEKSIG